MTKRPSCKRKPSSVRHTRSNQEARRQKQPAPPPDEITAQRIKEVIHPATLTQIRYYHDLGLRERVLTLPLMVAVVISLIWRQFASVSEGLRVLKGEGLLWAEAVDISQQALSERLRTLPSSLFERIVQDVLPQMQTKWQG